MSGWVYGIQSGRFIKVGKAIDINARMETYRLHNPHQLKLILKQEVLEPFWYEARMHRILEESAIGREWFRCAAIDVKEAYVLAHQEFTEAARNLGKGRGMTDIGQNLPV